MPVLYTGRTVPKDYAHQHLSPQKYVIFSQLFTYINKCLHFLAMYFSFVTTAAQRDSLRLYTAQVRVQIQDNPCGVCCGQRNNGRTAVFPCQLYFNRRSVFACHLPGGQSHFNEGHK